MASVPRTHGHSDNTSRDTTALFKQSASTSGQIAPKAKIFPSLNAQVGMTDTKSERQELTSLSQLVHEIIGGVARRHTFTQWELELLLDLQTCCVRKTSRPEVLRRYLRAVQQHFAKGEVDPLRLATFLNQENQRSRCSAPVQELSIA